MNFEQQKTKNNDKNIKLQFYKIDALPKDFQPPLLKWHAH